MRFHKRNIKRRFIQNPNRPQRERDRFVKTIVPPPAPRDNRCQLGLIGPIQYGDGLGRILPNLIYLLQDSFTLKVGRPGPGQKNCIYPEAIYPDSLPKSIREAYEKTDTLAFPSKTLPKIIIDTGIVWTPGRHPYVNSHLTKGIKKSGCYLISVSMLETTLIPPEWAQTLNEIYSEVWVPDKFLVEVYRNSGVRIPITVVSLPMLNIEEHLNKEPVQEKDKSKFVFGVLAGFWERKKVAETMMSFQKAFPGDESVQLKYHGRFGDDKTWQIIKNIVASDARIKVSSTIIPEAEMEKWKNSIDCYVLASAGEGFSFTPREMIARGIPTIVSSGSSHDTIIEEEGGIGIKVKQMLPAHYEYFLGVVGQEWEPDFDDLVERMKDVRNNYSLYQKQTLEKRSALEKYIPKNYIPFISKLILARANGVQQKKTRVLVVHHTPPECNSIAGGSNQFYELVKVLEKDGYKIKWIYEQDSPFRKEEPEWSVEQLPRLHIKRLENILKDFDPGLVFGYSWFPLEGRIKTIKANNIKIAIWAEHAGIKSLKESINNAKSYFSKEAFETEVSFYKREKAIYALSDLILAVSQKESKELKVYYPNTNYLPLVTRQKFNYSHNDNATEVALIMGTWHRGNVDSLIFTCDNFWPAIYKANNNKKLVLYGQATQGKEKLFSEELLKKYQSLVLDRGYVEDLELSLSNTRFTICPTISGSGVKVKGITSILCGVPVLMSRWAADEYGFGPEADLLIAKDTKDWINKIDLLINDEDLYKEALKTTHLLQSFFSEEKRDITLLNEIGRLIR